ncbi:MAG TPA: hypothetical protein VJ505_13455 [Holophagaceae bacterium]|nr:hypothetical protein [Holophagaceae bacterium]
MFRSLVIASCALVTSAFAQTPSTARTHLTVPATSLVQIELATRVDLSTGVVSVDAGTWENGKWQWFPGAKGFEVPKGRTLVITDAQAWALHESGSGTPASLELILDHPKAGYSGSMALFSFPDLGPNVGGVQRQVWTSGFVVPETVQVKLWVQQFYPRSLMSMARIILHGYYL